MSLRRTFFGALALAAMAVMAVSQEASAQIYNDYTLRLVPRIYQPQTARGVIIPRSSFVELFSGVVDPDNGVAGPIPIGFDFDYNGQTYNQIYVSVNGWISFRNPLTTGSAGFFGDDPYSLFNNTRPNLTVAPFFGDHYLRTPGFDTEDPSGRLYTPSFVRYVLRQGTDGAVGPDTLVVEWENLNINYRFDPTDPDNPFANPANVRAQATSIGTFQVYLIENDSTAQCLARQGSIEFHYGPVGNRGIVKVSGASVGIEDEPAVPGGNTNFMNAVAWLQSGFDRDSLLFSRRLTSTYPPTGFPSQVFRFESNCRERAPGWGDGDADLTQLNRSVPTRIREDQRLFVTFADVILILRHTASRNVDFDSVPGRHGFHGDVNHNGRFFFSTRNYNNTLDSTNSNGDIIRYKKFFPTKDVNPELPFPNDNSFSGFLFDADEMDAALIMLYLAAKLPVLPWLPDTLPHFTGKVAPITHANDITLGGARTIGGRRVEIPVTFNGAVSGASGVSFDVANGARIVEVRTMPRTDRTWVEATASDNRVAIAAAGNFREDDVVAVLVVEADQRGDVAFGNVSWNNEAKSARKLNIYGATTGEATTLSIAQNFPNPFTVNMPTTLAYTVPSAGTVSVRIFNVLGREIATVVESELGAGTYTAQWNGIDAAGKPVDAGVYYARIEANGEVRTVPMHVEK
jgi:hypothetical protein